MSLEKFIRDNPESEIKVVVADYGEVKQMKEGDKESWY